jgi:general L-amino acid transport system substrate-binding protein
LVRQVDGKTKVPETDAEYLARVGPQTARFLDPLFGIGAQLGLAPDFMSKAIVAVGNYGEIYVRHFGPQGDLPLLRGMNSLVTGGGMIYAPDWQ